MNTSAIKTHGGVFQRLLVLYGLFALTFDICFVVAYYFLPRASCGAVRRWLAGNCGKRSLVLVSVWPDTTHQPGPHGTVAVLANFNQVKGIPAGYLIAPVLASLRA